LGRERSARYVRRVAGGSITGSCAVVFLIGPVIDFVAIGVHAKNNVKIVAGLLRLKMSQ